jgi:hypothetical protein
MYSIIPLVALPPLLEVVGHEHLPFLVRFSLISLPYAALSLFGLFMFLGTKPAKQRIVLIVVLLAVSLLFFFAFPISYSSYCVRG